MSLADFDTQLANVNTLLDQLTQLANNEGVDVLDLSILDSSSEAIALAAFGPDNKMTAPLIIAYREAFDFVTSFKRFIAEEKLTRADYYTKSAEDIELIKKRFELLKAQLTQYTEKGAVK